VGAGLSTAELGLRLRYEFVPNFAPYVGVVYSQGFGATKRFVREEGEDPGRIQFVAGIRTWF
jgi:copper resistance protein B